MRPLADRCMEEILELHAFFEGWMGGAAMSEAALSRCASALAPGFILIGPDGRERMREPVLAGLRAQRRAHADAERPFRLWIERPTPRFVRDGLCLATYEEWQTSHGQTTARRSSALFIESPTAPRGVAWLHLHETWLEIEGHRVMA
jgi:hypothetical protein